MTLCKNFQLLPYYSVLLIVSVVCARATAQDLPEQISFNRDIRPIFNKHCTACHGGVKQAAGVSFVYAEQVVAPDGWIVEPGEPDFSSLLDRVKSDDPEARMPPPEHGRALNKNEIDLLTRWIEQGAKWSNHWAFEKPLPQKIPAVQKSDWPLQSIDHFVLARLEKEKIKPAQTATPERWLRRVTLDLTGLPPTLEERNAFVKKLEQSTTNQQKEAVYNETVDQLLNSPAYGERWATVWLDQIRYADSKGLGIDGRRNVWKYRDWVIDALNRDMPYDQFTVKQIAGDLLPNSTIEDLIATAAHRVTQTNEEGGTDDEEFRIAAVLDRVNTTWQAWHGVTFGCVQCHSHPYDPFRQDEYYKFAAFFNNTADTDLDQDWPTVQVPINTSDYEAASKLDQRIESLNQQIWETEYSVLADNNHWKPLKVLTAKTNNQTKVTIESKPDHDEYHTVDTVSRNTDFTLTAPIPDGLRRLTAIRFTAMPLDPETAVSDSEWGFSLSHVTASLIVPGKEKPQPIEIARLIGDEPNPFFEPNESLNEKSGRGFAAYTRIYRPRSAALVLKTPIDIPEGARLQVVLKHRVFILAAFRLIARRGHLAVSDSDAFANLATDKSLDEKRKRLSELRKKRNAIKSTSVPVLRERPEHLARTQHVFIRGLFLTKDKQVSPATPASFPPLKKDADIDRLDLANWMVSPENPLTARVAVNRMWARIFGIGIVATEEDFGSSGEPPSHPALLDHLARKFQNEFAWSQKKVIKEIVLSATYRQSSAIRTELLERDSANRLLARGPRQRLSAETVRDQSLAIAGLLSDKKYGPPVHPPIPDGVWKPFQGGDKWDTPKPESEDRYRRSIYTYTKRSIPYPMFAAFDSPSREVCTPRRLRSNTPIQALMLLNDQTLNECADAFAKKMQASAEKIRDQLHNGFIMATCREPRADELDVLVDLLKQYNDEEKSAGWNAVAKVLLNLDEVVTQ